MMVLSVAQFRPFSLLHWAMVAGLSLLWGCLIELGLKGQGTARLRRAEQGVAWMMVGAWLAVKGWWLLPANFNLAYSLPIEICDLLLLIVAFTFLWGHRGWVTLLYFWGLGLSLQGILTPDLQAGPQHPEFWLFWFHHGVIVGTALYQVIVYHYHPTWRDYRQAVAVGLAYLAIIFPLNILLQLNYGYLGQATPSQPSLIDFLGPWPWRVAIMTGLAVAVMALLLLPWVLHHRHQPESCSRQVDDS
jgi:hypothetical integral membrane protein (TIGR02206 family)